MNDNKYELIEDKNCKSTYRVEKIHDDDEDGEIEQAIFLGKNAYNNAIEYQNFKKTKGLKMSSIKDLIIKELQKSVYILGAKSDLLCITGSYGDTLSDDEVLNQLSEWNRLNSANNS